MKLLLPYKAHRLVPVALSIIGVFFGISGCALITPDSTPVPHIVPRDPVELVSTVAQRVQRFQSLRALASVYYWGTDGRAGFQEAVLVDRPDRLRLETLSSLGAVLVVTADANEIAGFHPRESLFFRGKSSKENLLRYTQIPLELVEVTSLLMGLPPVNLEGPWKGNGNSVSWILGGGRREVVAFDPALGIPTKWERLNSDGRVELSAQFAEFSPTPAGPFPLKISLQAPGLEKRLEIRYQEPEINVKLPPNLFLQERPANAREIPLESVGG